MNKLEYDRSCAAIERKKNEAIERLSSKYALSNSPYKIGDIVEDHFHTIRIEKIKLVFSFTHKTPECYYTGVELTKKLRRKKRQDTTFMHQSNVRRKVN